MDGELVAKVTRFKTKSVLQPAAKLLKYTVSRSHQVGCSEGLGIISCLLPGARQNVKPTHNGLSEEPTHNRFSRKPTHSEITVKPTHSEISVKPNHSGLSAKPTNSGLSVKPTPSGFSVKTNLSIVGKI